MTIAAVVTAAGSGTRLGRDVPKALVPISGTPMLAWAASAAAAVAGRVIITAPRGALDQFRAVVSHVAAEVVVVEGGADRQESVVCALAELGGGIEAVLVHDAARPFAPVAVFGNALQGLDDADGVIPILPVVDTIIRQGGAGVTYFDRSTLGAVQTPQAFRPDALLDAHARAARDGVAATDDGALLVHYGHKVDTCVGSADARKVTFPEDIEFFERRHAK